ncbi:hypothetical protein [Rhodococcus jostii]|uniref:hypothetical protein n=1 Tax=Rhodococcus jostii TaxID=132919 RepID=UPI0036455894
MYADPELARILALPSEGDCGAGAGAVRPKRGERVAPPAAGELWELRFATTDAVKGWDELCRQAPANTLVAYEEM